MCVYTVNFDEGIDVGFALLESPLDGITLDIGEVSQDETGTFPATITVMHEDGRRFRTEGCTVDVTQHVPAQGGPDEIGVPYQVAGEGSCSDPAVESNDPSQVLNIDAFAFSAPTAWQP